MLESRDPLEFEKQLNLFASEINHNINLAQTDSDLEQARQKAFSKKSFLSVSLKSLKDLDLDSRKKIAAILNQLKQDLEQKIKQKKLDLLSISTRKIQNANQLDLTLSGRTQQSGSLHPVTLVQMRLESIFSKFGFEIETGPEIEDDFHNFSALNVPDHHPARASHDTFYIEHSNSEYLLRTHTSPVQVRTLLRLKNDLPTRFIAPGRVYRCDYDVTHTPMFHQIEGLIVDQGVHFGHLKSLLTELMRLFFESHVKTRFRPSYFPFTEPSAEMDVSCMACPKDGGVCRICKNTGWLEVLGCGLIHPNVLKQCGIDSEKYTGLAFGAGLDRLAMLCYSLPDLRQLFENDIRFLKQFN